MPRSPRRASTRANTLILLVALSLWSGTLLAQTAPDNEDRQAPPPAIGADEREGVEEGPATGVEESVEALLDEPAPVVPVTPVVPFASATPMEPAATPAVSVDPDKPVQTSGDRPIESHFTFASYGRVRGATDMRGGRPGRANVISHGSRIDEYNYAELEFQQLFLIPKSAQEKFYAQVVATLAFDDNLFHFTGQFDQGIAMRNLYADVGWKLDALSLGFWAGSRMYRGDDIYLLDFWPLDNLNTVGAGGVGAFDMPGFGRAEIKLHSGTSRLNDPFQLQIVQVPGFQFGTDDVVFLNRQRTISSARFQQDIWLTKRADGSPTSGVKAVLYAEDHRLPQGARRLDDGLNTELLPAESGRRMGAQLGIWRADGFFKGSFANLFLVADRDLAAYGEFGIPTGLSINKTSEGATSRMVALSADLETPYAGVLVGSYYKYFQNADRDAEGFDDYWEGTVSARAHAYLTDHIHPGIEYSYQVRRPFGPFPGTDSFEVPAVSKLSFIQAIRLKKGMYNRPEVRFIYTRSQLNRSAVALFPNEDPRRDQVGGNGALTTHYVGAMVEWWFNNASLFRP